jgi:hypothetical protein
VINHAAFLSPRRWYTDLYHRGAALRV